MTMFDHRLPKSRPLSDEELARQMIIKAAPDQIRRLLEDIRTLEIPATVSEHA